MADYKTTKSTGVDLLITDIFNLEQYNPDEILQLLVNHPNPLVITHDFANYCIKNPAFYQTSREIVSVCINFVLFNFNEFPEFGELAKAIEVLSEVSDEFREALISFGFYSDSLFKVILDSAIKENAFDIVCNITCIFITNGFHMDLSALFSLAQVLNIQSKSVHLVAFLVSQSLSDFCPECVIASGNYLISSQKDIRFYNLGKEAYKAFIGVFRFLNDKIDVDFKTIIYDLQQTLQRFPDNLNVYASIPEMLLEIYEISADTFNEEEFIFIPTKLIRRSTNLLAKYFNEQSQTVSALCLHAALLIGDIDDIEPCIECFMFLFSYYSSFYTNLKLVLIEYLKAFIEDEHLSCYLNNLPKDEICDDLFQLIDFHNENIDSIAIFRLMISMGVQIEIDHYAQELDVEREFLESLL